MSRFFFSTYTPFLLPTLSKQLKADVLLQLFTKPRKYLRWNKQREKAHCEMHFYVIETSKMLGKTEP